MVAFATREGTLEVPEVLVRAIINDAERCADLVAAFLDATGLFPDRPICLPAGFLLELSAVLQLGMWERQGLHEYLSADLPTFAEAAGQLGRRAGRGPAEFDKLDENPLHQRVLGVWIRSFAWEAQDLLGAEVVVGALADESAFVDALAEFAWRHRHELSQILST